MPFFFQSKQRFSLWCAGWLALVLGLVAVPAQAAFYYCNKLQDPLEAAMGYREGSQWVSEGWWRVAPGECAKIVAEPLQGRFYYYYARTIRDESIEWGGDFIFCIDDQPFKITGDRDCESRDLYSVGFAAIDVGTERDFYLDFQ